ncbi:M56 family metallopeptidase [Longimicrobium sp.]|uniref:M56 family metallopeptidase n=1 Tax=Longimicrobium sp. TaxID=2029185 RepID=UPI003B3A3284
MIAQWMLYCLAVGALLSLAALATERAMRAFALPQRWVWATAMVLMLAIPAAARWMPRAPAPTPAATAPGGEGTRLRLADFPAAAAESASRVDAAALDGPLAIGWMMASAAAVLALLAAWAVLERRRRGWKAAEVDGVRVLLSPATGPAVIGFFRSRIVLPRWVVEDAPAEVRALLLQHEQEHLRAGDPRLLALGLAAVAVMPWNPAAWWQLRRLRLAVEVDCDARVLARRADVRAYGTLLLEVGRRGAGGRLLAAAFSEPASFLERRIRIMTSPRARRPWLRAAGFGAAALAMVAAACEAPGPVQPSPSPASTTIETVSGGGTMAMPNGSGISRSAIEAAVRAHYPEVFSAAPTASASLLFVVDTDGTIARHERVQLRRPGGAQATGPETASRARQPSKMSSDEMRESMVDVVGFSPGQMGPGRVEVLWIRKLTPGQRVASTETTREREPAGQEPPFRESPTSKVEITAEQAREYVARYLPEVARNGTTAEFVWIIADASGQVLEYGDSDHSEALNRDMESIANVQVFKTESLVFNGHPVSLVYVTRKA